MMTNGLHTKNKNNAIFSLITLSEDGEEVSIVCKLLASYGGEIG